MTTRPQTLSVTTAPRTIGAVRDEIDRIDDAMLELVEARVDLTRAMARLKDEDTSRRLKIRPRREVEVVERLTGRARIADAGMVEHIWRTLMAYGLQDQAPMQLVLYADPTTDRLAFHECVRARFGPAATLRWAADAREALDAARDTEAVAVVAMSEPPNLDEAAGSGDTGLRVFEALKLGSHFAHAIGRVGAEDVLPSGAAR